MILVAYVNVQLLCLYWNESVCYGGGAYEIKPVSQITEQIYTLFHSIQQLSKVHILTNIFYDQAVKSEPFKHLYGSNWV